MKSPNRIPVSVIWWLVALAFLVCSYGSFFSNAARGAAYRATLFLLVAASVAAFVSWCRTLVARRWRRAVLQFLVGAVSLAVFAVAFAATFVEGASKAKAAFAAEGYSNIPSTSSPPATQGSADGAKEPAP